MSDTSTYIVIESRRQRPRRRASRAARSTSRSSTRSLRPKTRSWAASTPLDSASVNVILLKYIFLGQGRANSARARSWREHGPRLHRRGRPVRRGSRDEGPAPFNRVAEPSLSVSDSERYIYIELRRQRPGRGAWSSQPSSPSTSFERAVDEKGK